MSEIDTTPMNATASLIYAARERAAEAEHDRAHLGASLIGRRCERYLWLSFRWAAKRQFSGRMLRLFERGQLEEARAVADLRAIGCVVSDADSQGNQHRVSFHGGHFGGSLDGALCKLPEAPHRWHVLEIKTHNAKSFAALVRDGVQTTKPEHYAQMQTYMAGTGMDRALYFAVNKDTDEVYTERVKADEVQQAALIGRAERIIFANEPPARISDNPAWYECKMCDMHAICHSQGPHAVAPRVNCRTCAHSTPLRDGDAAWQCEQHNKRISITEQRVGCDTHRHMPPMISQWAEIKDADAAKNWVQYINTLTENTFEQGGDPLHGDTYTSHEITASEDKRFIGSADARLWKLADPTCKVAA